MADAAPEGTFRRSSIPVRRDLTISTTLFAQRLRVEPPKSAVQPNEIRILIACDEPILREGVLSLVSRKPGMSVIGQVVDAVSLAQQVLAVRPDLLLMSVPFAEESAGRVLVRLRREIPERSMPLTLILADDLTLFQAMEALDLGARGLMSKHSDLLMLVKAIGCVAAGEYWVKRDVFVAWVQSRKHTERIHELSDRERMIVDEVLSGASNRAIGEACGIAESTAQRHLANIYKKLGVSGRLELAVYAAKNKF